MDNGCFELSRPKPSGWLHIALIVHDSVVDNEGFSVFHNGVASGSVTRSVISYRMVSCVLDALMHKSYPNFYTQKQDFQHTSHGNKYSCVRRTPSST